jgi:hypothetical protein
LAATGRVALASLGAAPPTLLGFGAGVAEAVAGGGTAAGAVGEVPGMGRSLVIGAAVKVGELSDVGKRGVRPAAGVGRSGDDGSDAPDAANAAVPGMGRSVAREGVMTLDGTLGRLASPPVL